MNKNTLRSLGFGFLSSAIITGAFAIFFQGNIPVQGIQISSVLNNNTVQYESELAQYREEMSSLISDRDALESTRENLNTSIASLNDLNEEQSSLIASMEANQSESDETVSEDEESEDEAENSENEETLDESEESETSETETSEETTTTEENDTTTDEFISGTFTINSGESSTEIADRLENEGYIASSAEFQELIDYWGLDSILQANDYELNSDMTIHQIAETITNGQYYYIP